MSTPPLTVRIPASIDLRLTPNRANTNRHVKARLKAELNETTGQAFLNTPRDRFADAALPLTFDYVIARGRGRQAFDDDNAAGGLKWVRDSIAQYFGVNDRHILTGSIEQIRDPDGIGFIDVCIRESDATERQTAA